MGFSRKEDWSRLPCPPPGDLPDSGIEPPAPELQVDFFIAEPLREPAVKNYIQYYATTYKEKESGKGYTYI